MGGRGYCVAALGLLAALAAGLPAQGACPLSKPKPEVFYVLTVRDHQGKVSFEGVDAAKCKDREKELSGQLLKDYAEACKAWKLAKRQAEEAKEPFSQPEPVKPIVKRGKRVVGERDLEIELARLKKKLDGEKGGADKAASGA